MKIDYCLLTFFAKKEVAVVVRIHKEVLSQHGWGRGMA